MAGHIVIALLIGLGVMLAGRAILRLVFAPGSDPMKANPLAGPEGFQTFLVCRECGAEFQVAKPGTEGGTPRHCGERMAIEMRPVR